MAYTSINFKTKKELRQALLAGEKITVFQPGPFGEARYGTITSGKVYLEGPHSPQPHRWYAQGEVKDGYLIKVK